jgi:hypothetical protein
VTGNAVSEGSSRVGNFSPQSVILNASQGPNPRWWITQFRLHNHRPLARSLTPKRGFRDDMRVVLGNGDRILAFALSSRATRGTSPKLVDHTGWLTQDRLLDVWPISHSDYLCMSLQNRSVCGKRSDRGDVAAACESSAVTDCRYRAGNLPRNASRFLTL